MPRHPTSFFNSKYLFVEQPLHKASEFSSKLLVHLSAILFALASAQACFNHVTLVSTTGVLVAHFAIVFVRSYMPHVRMVITGGCSGLRGVLCLKEGVFFGLKEGMSSGQYSTE